MILLRWNAEVLLLYDCNVIKPPWLIHVTVIWVVTGAHDKKLCRTFLLVFETSYVPFPWSNSFVKLLLTSSFSCFKNDQNYKPCMSVCSFFCFSQWSYFWMLAHSEKMFVQNWINFFPKERGFNKKAVLMSHESTLFVQPACVVNIASSYRRARDKNTSRVIPSTHFPPTLPPYIYLLQARAQTAWNLLAKRLDASFELIYW